MLEYEDAKKIMYSGLQKIPKNKTTMDKHVLYLNLANCYYFLHENQTALLLLDSA